MITSKEAELSTLIRHIDRFSKSGVLIYNSEVLNMDQDRRHPGGRGRKNFFFHRKIGVDEKSNKK